MSSNNIVLIALLFLLKCKDNISTTQLLLLLSLLSTTNDSGCGRLFDGINFDGRNSDGGCHCNNNSQRNFEGGCCCNNNQRT